jgi:hypothetical protein
MKHLVKQQVDDMTWHIFAILQTQQDVFLLGKWERQIRVWKVTPDRVKPFVAQW